MTQQELADAAGVDLKTVYNLESGNRWPIARTRVAISAALQWEADALAEMAAGHEAPPLAARPRRERRLKALEDSDPEGLEPFLQAVLRQVYTAAGIISAFPPDRDLPGLDQLPELEPVLEQMPGETAFPDSATDPLLWDNPLLSAAERVRLVARMRHMYAKAAGGARDRRVSGLTASRRLVSR